MLKLHALSGSCANSLRVRGQCVDAHTIRSPQDSYILGCECPCRPQQLRPIGWIIRHRPNQSKEDAGVGPFKGPGGLECDEPVSVARVRASNLLATRPRFHRKPTKTRERLLDGETLREVDRQLVVPRAGAQVARTFSDALA